MYVLSAKKANTLGLVNLKKKAEGNIVTTRFTIIYIIDLRQFMMLQSEKLKKYLIQGLSDN